MPDFSYPIRHISVRVPWHDNGWNGSVCNDPKFNTACLKLKNISDSKDEKAEEAVKGSSFQDLLARDVPFPPCVNERATFMADFDFVQRKRHPYVETSPRTHGHFRPTPLRHPPYGAAALPFRWMMRSEVFGEPENGIAGFVDRFPLDEVSADLEPSLSFDTNWLQDHRNHRALLDCFWSHVRPHRSLVFFYAKQVPFVEDTGRRVLIGVGRVKTIGELTEYRYDGPPRDRLRSLLWERMVVHSIRPEFEDGFLLPYHDVMAKSDDGRAFDPAETVAFAPEDRFVEFSFATEHVGDDAAISALLAMRGSLHRCSELFGYAADASERWIDRELGRLWKKRGPFPGLGAVLSAMGIGMGNFIAQALLDETGENASPWPAWFKALDDLHRFSSDRYSAAACRLTNLFGPPRPIEFKGRFLEERLIHNTMRGELVRSKSEVIIANLLHARNIDYEYEQQLIIDGVSQDKFPDFTIEDDDTGVKYVWEHLGMLGDRSYKRRWSDKEQWYRDNGILPHEEGGGPNGTRIVTRDDPRGGMDSSSIDRLIEDVLNG